MNSRMRQYLRFQRFFITLLALGFAQGALAQFRPMAGVEFYIQAAEAFETGQNIGFWDVPGGDPQYNQGQNIQVWAMDSGADRKFLFYPDRTRNGYYYILPAHALKAGGRDRKSVV